MSYKAVLFDLDGTLLNTIDDLTDAMNAALAEIGCPPRTVAQCKYLVGDGVRNFCTRALPEDRRDAATVDKLLPIYRNAYAARWDKKSKPYEGVPELLDGLFARKFTVVVYSNKPDEFTTKAVAKLLPKWQFAAVVGARPGVPHKPDPSAALNIAGKLGIAPARFVYVGDTNTDMRTATSAGMFAVGALWGYRTAQELLDSDAKALIEKPLDLLKIIDR